MTRNLLCAVYLLIAIGTAHSASYYFRAGREIIVPNVDEIKAEVISELKKEGPILVEEIVTVQNVTDKVEPAAEAVKSVPENVAPVVESIQSVDRNVVAADAAVPPIVPSDVVNDEARAKSVSSPAIRLDTLEVIQPGGKSDKVQTVAETVKNAAVQAIEKQNEEFEKAKPVETVVDVNEIKFVDASAVKTVVEPNLPVESVAVVKSPESVEPAVEEVKPVPAVDVEKVVESVRSVDAEPAKNPEQAKEEKVEKIEKIEQVEKLEPAAEAKAEVVVEPIKVSEIVEKVEKIEKSQPEVVVQPARQESGATPPANPITAIQGALATLQQNFLGLVQNVIPRPQSDVPLPASGGLNTNEIATNAAVPSPAAAATAAAAAPTTAAPNVIVQNLQNVQNAINNLATNLFQRPTPTPAVSVDAVSPAQTGTRGDQTGQSAQAAQATTSSPNLISNLASNVQNAINNFATSIFPRTTQAPTVSSAAAANPGPNIVKGTRGEEDEVEVVHNIDIVNDKVDLAKKGQ